MVNVQFLRLKVAFSRSLEFCFWLKNAFFCDFEGLFSALTMLILGSFYLQNEVFDFCEMINYVI